jgi:RNA polymerase sigma-70 factor (sigma-E family)
MSAADQRYEQRFDTLAAIAHRTAFRLLGDRSAADDVAQEAMARAFARWRRIEAYAEPWVARVAGNLALGELRRQRRPAPPAPADDDRGRGGEGAVDDRRLLVDALRALPAGQRDTVLLRFVADLPEAEVARLLGCSVGTVKSQAHRALARLRPLVAVDDQPLPAPAPALDQRST